ncbi:helix-turn-helix domain-containing protein [Gemmata sp.]|uniref:helix-turn-helix domain-containing protein n=1 Tax=Gemmata sp. TaxID=1914242 RepID=UPI003F710D35
MSDITSGFDFEQWVPAKGYRWCSWKELGVTAVWGGDDRDPVREAAGPGSGGSDRWVLILDVSTEDEWLDRVAVSLAGRPALYREFAELDPTDIEALAKFANANGELGLWHRAYCDPRGAAKKLYGASKDDNDPFTGQTSTSVTCESRDVWAQQVASLRTACEVYDLLASSDPKRVKRHLQWRPTPFVGERASTHLPAEGWYFDTHPDLPSEAEVPGRDARFVNCGSRDSRFDDPVEVAWTWLLGTINERLAKAVSPVLARQDGRTVQRLAPRTLLAALWSQLHGAIMGGKTYTRCASCNRLIEVATNLAKGRTVRAAFCGDACRVTAYRKRKARAVELSEKGMTPKQIADEVGSDADTVKGWIKQSKWGKN